MRYTPKAVQLIRNGASAADLGWSASMYDSVCTTHGISHGSKTNDIVRYQNPKSQIVEFREKSGEVIRNSIIVALPRNEAELFAALYKRWLADNDSFASASALFEMKVYGAGRGDRVDMKVNRAAHRISQSLSPIRIWIETKHRVGYRLRVDA
jgi:hypothetical protein